jgi:hypothetical protein
MSCCNLTKSGWIFPVVVVAMCLGIVGTVTRKGSIADDKKAAAPMLRHVVLFKFKDSSTPADIEKILAEFSMLPKKIPQIVSFEWGTNNSPEGLADGFTHCFFISFASEKDRDDYLPHNAHKAFVDIVKPHLDKVLVVDYWAK